MAILLSRLPPSSTWDFISISQDPLRTLSRQSSRRLVVLGRLFSGVIHCFSVAIPLACICACCKLQLSAVLVPVLLQRLYDYYLRTVCLLSPSTRRKLLLTELGLLPLQVFWWRQTLQFWNSLAVLPAGSLYHTVCLDNLADAFQGGACNMASSLAV